jgi:hypothetical protein
MSEYSKKLYIRKSGITQSISLYTTIAEVGMPCLCLRDGSTSLFAKIGKVGSHGGTDLRVRKDGNIYQVLSFVGGYMDINKAYSLTNNSESNIAPSYTYTFAVPSAATIGTFTSGLHAEILNNGSPANEVENAHCGWNIADVTISWRINNIEVAKDYTDAYSRRFNGAAVTYEDFSVWDSVHRWDVYGWYLNQNISRTFSFKQNSVVTAVVTLNHSFIDQGFTITVTCSATIKGETF